MTYPEQIEDQKMKEKDRESKRVGIDVDGFFHQRSGNGGYGRGQGVQGYFGQGSSNTFTKRFNKNKRLNHKFKEEDWYSS